MIEINKTKTTSEFSKSVEIPTNITFSFIVNEINKKFLIIKGRYYAEKIYVGIPSFISFYSKNRFLTFYSSLNKQDKMAIFENFIYKLNSAVKSVRKKFKKVVILKGMGLKLNYNKVLERLELKLGYSHMVNVDLNNEKKKIFLKTSKNTLIV
jgi:ribosomal protein L6P/L9E